MAAGLPVEQLDLVFLSLAERPDSASVLAPEQGQLKKSQAAPR
jgi:hypothetical protein